MSLSVSEQLILNAPPISYMHHLSLIQDAINVNGKLAAAIAQHGVKIWKKHSECQDHIWKGTAAESDCAIIRSSIRQFFRDWSVEGATERVESHKPIVKALQKEFCNIKGKELVKVLVPGCGLSRLLYTICLEGFTVEGNEISHHQLLASQFILQHREEEGQFTLFPWIQSFSNHICREDQFQKVLVPDVYCGSVLDKEQRNRLSLNAAPFTTYRNKDHTNLYDAVATVFFLDTAPNLLRYMETVHNCLRPGGIWINVGPLLWNCEENGPGGRGEGDTDEDHACKSRMGHGGAIGIGGKLEFTQSDVLSLLGKFGFSVEVYEVGAKSTYIGNKQSMLQSVYTIAYWVARKN
jgi:carnosine N-methyltransferase